MQRDVIIVLGKTGFGKSLWSRLYCQGQTRKLVYDPLLTIESCYVESFQLYDLLVVEEGFRRSAKPFDFGIYCAIDCDLLGCLAYYLGNCLLVLEECSTVFEKGIRNLPAWSRRLCFLGRHQAASVLLISQRAMNIPIDFRSQANRIITFQQHEDDDLSWLIGFFGKEAVSRMPKLDFFECLDYTNGQISSYSIESQVRERLGIDLKLPQSAMMM